MARCKRYSCRFLKLLWCGFLGHHGKADSSPVIQMDEATRQRMLAEAQRGLPHAKRVFGASVFAFGTLLYVMFSKPVVIPPKPEDPGKQ